MALDLLLSWAGGQSLLNVGIAVTVALGFALLPLGPSETWRLEKRARGITRTDVAGGQGRQAQQLGLLHAVAAQIRFAEKRQKLVDWLLDHTSVGRTYQQRFRQAGLRNPRIAVQFGAMRVMHGLSGVVCGCPRFCKDFLIGVNEIDCGRVSGLGLRLFTRRGPRWSVR